MTSNASKREFAIGSALIGPREVFPLTAPLVPVGDETEFPPRRTVEPAPMRDPALGPEPAADELLAECRTIRVRRPTNSPAGSAFDTVERRTRQFSGRPGPTSRAGAA